MIDLYKDILRNGLLGTCFRELCLSRRKGNLDLSPGSRMFSSATIIEPVNDTGAGPNDNAETISTEK